MAEVKYDNNLLREALLFVVVHHEGQVRKVSKVPYIFHPVEVMILLQDAVADIQTQIAGLLHDCIEDSYIKIEKIESKFGQEVDELVYAETEKKI